MLDDDCVELELVTEADELALDSVVLVEDTEVLADDSLVEDTVELVLDSMLLDEDCEVEELDSEVVVGET